MAEEIKKARSGAKEVTYKNKNGDQLTGISAWNATNKNRGLVKVFISPTKDSDEIHESKTGNQYVRMMCKLFWVNSGIEKIESVLMNVNTKRVIIESLGWVVNPKAKNGGYCARFTNNSK